MWSVWAWLVGWAAARLPPPPSTPQAAGVVAEEGRCLSHLVSGAEGRLAELADLPDVFPGHHPSPPETPTYHALDVGVQAQRRRALRFAAGREDTGKQRETVRVWRSFQHILHS